MKSYLFVTILMVSILFFNTTEVQGANEELQVTFTTNPVIVAPGTNGYIEVNVKSIGSGTINDIDIQATSWDASVIQPKGNWDVYVGDLDGGDSIAIFYEFLVPSTANPGLYQVVFEIDYYPGHDIKQTAFVKVENPTVLDLVSVTPSSIDIGEATTVIFNVTNNGGSDAENILFTWEDTSALILPVGSDNRIIVSSIEGGNYSEIPIRIMASPSITPGVYPLIITMEFYDRTGTKQTVTSTVGLQIGGTTDFEIVLQQSMAGATTFAVANTGSNVASSVIVSIPPQVNYITSGVDSVSLGNLDAGDYTLASFQLSSVDSNTTQRPFFDKSSGDMPSDFDPSMMENFRNRTLIRMGDNNLILEISYTDLFGVRQTVEKEVTVTSISSSVASDFTSRLTGRPGMQNQSSDTGLMYIIIGVIGIILIIAIIQLGKKKKLPNFSKLIKGNKK